MTDFPVETLTARPFAFLSRSVALPEMPATMGAVYEAVAATFARARAPMEGPAWCRYTAYDGTTVGFDAGFAARPQDCAALRGGPFHRRNAVGSGDDRLAHRCL